jgi:hypothetical protein
MLKAYIKGETDMTQVDKLEALLDETLRKKAPYQMPESNRKTLAGALWWVSLVFGVLQLWAAWSLWHAGHYIDRLADYSNALATQYGIYTPAAPHLSTVYYTTLLMLALSAALLLLAAPGLKAMHLSGWKILFYSLLANAIYGLLNVFSDYGSPQDLVFTAGSTVLGLYLLFQVRDYFKLVGVSTPRATSKATK